MSDHSDWLESIGRYVDGAASAEEVRALEAALRTDAGLRREFLRYLHLDAALVGATEGLRAPLAVERRMFLRPAAWFAAAAALLLAAALAWLLVMRPPRATPPFASLTAATAAVWADPNVEAALRSGDLPRGELRLDSGSAEFLFLDGATLVARGPAVLRIPERKRVFVESGRVFCRCPSPASRLTVETPSAQVVDLGTEFAVEARADRSTLVAVLSGEVQVGGHEPRRLREGEAAEVRGDGILVIPALGREDFAELLRASPTVDDALRRGANRLRDPGFEQGLGGAWGGTEENAEALAEGGRTGGAVRVLARGAAHWPNCRQTVSMAGDEGKLVIASVWARVPEGDPLRARQVAMLKLAFKQDDGRDFAFASRRFLSARSTPGEWERVEVAAFAPPGTRAVQLQLMLQSDLRPSGSVLFDDASLVVADAPTFP